MSDVYAKLHELHQKKPAPPGFRIAEKCCIECNHCYDESSITACTKHGWFAVEWFNVCDSFEGS